MKHINNQSCFIYPSCHPNERVLFPRIKWSCWESDQSFTKCLVQLLSQLLPFSIWANPWVAKVPSFQSRKCLKWKKEFFQEQMNDHNKKVNALFEFEIQWCSWRFQGIHPVWIIPQHGRICLQQESRRTLRMRGLCAITCSQGWNWSSWSLSWLGMD